MSTDLVERSFQESAATGTRAQVLTYLCWRANDDGIAWPKRSTIAEAAGVSEKQVKRHVKALVEAGELWYKPGRGRGNASTYVPTVGLEKGDIQQRLMTAGLEKGDADGEASAIIARRKGDTDGEKGDTQGQKPPTDGEGKEKGTSEKRGHSWGEKGTPVGGFSDPPKKDNHSTPLELQTRTNDQVVVEASSTTLPERIPDWFPPGDLRTGISETHPARSERHLRYRKAAEWSLRLLLRAEGAIESFRVPAAVRRKAERKRLELLRDWQDIFRLLEEQDRYEWSDVRYAIYWLFTESDWLREGYIASMGSLRKKTSSGDQTKFESILTQAQADSSYDGPNTNGRIGGDDRPDESPAERFDRKRRAARRAVASG